MTGKRRWRLLAPVSLAVVAALSLSACGSSSSSSSTSSSGNQSSGEGKTASGGREALESINVTAVFPNSLKGNLYNEIHNGALEAAAKSIGENKVHYKSVFGIEYNQQMTHTTEQLFQQNQNLVIDDLSAGQLFSEACKKNPEKMCAGLYSYIGETSEPPAPNLASFYQDDAPMWYVEGLAAGELTKSGTVGFVSTFKQAFDTAVVNAFALGCQKTHPGCQVRNVYINSFYDPPKSVEAANALINSGADVINSFLDDPSALKVAGEHGVWGFGVYADQSQEAPQTWVTGVEFEKGLTKTYEEIFNAALDGSFKGGQMFWGTPKPPNLNLAPFGPKVPAAVKTNTEKALKEIEGGKNPFVGPIEDTTGKVRIPKGKEIEIRGSYLYTKWLWPVKGVIGL
ncbi:MAG: BMP family ABC transporter substrate-binding protein [Actinobacteria bacterium]|nr:BMP family ABC transporter substrate-binding protein [Actinomycetota bacterium]